MTFRNHDFLDQFPAPNLAPRDPERVNQMIEECRRILPPHLLRFFDAVRTAGLDMMSAAHCKILAAHFGVKPGTLRSYRKKIRELCSPLREKFVALHEENS